MLEILFRYSDKKIIHPTACEIRELILNIYLYSLSLLLLNSSLNHSILLEDEGGKTSSEGYNQTVWLLKKLTA